MLADKNIEIKWVEEDEEEQENIDSMMNDAIETAVLEYISLTVFQGKDSDYESVWDCMERTLIDFADKHSDKIKLIMDE
jgi:hypothetical protein